ncbi:PPE family protein [Mycobacterium haemophilum DSM 44634]|uniref:PPE family protein n=1 Tax=Mycobacterium haemophilum TaxID=29311 RepID=UPI0006D429DC|nr:PPE family protein [Mycobacterium haemophilum]ALL56328.1 hypothetical protein B586_05150 [Mycobacterium haemophilum DSM 44634]MCV7339971.1 PPE family protein [Mycobacterium haemophilum DSM 44634]
MYYENCPPEVISGDMFTGPGSGSMVNAINWWHGLAWKMWDIEEAFTQVLGGLQQQWSGPVATELMLAAGPFVRWLCDVVVQVKETADKIDVIAWAYFQTLNRVVHVDAISYNRDARADAVRNNALGQRNAEIAELDQEYETFRAMDIGVMKDYEDAVFGALSKLAPWKSPPPIAKGG